VSYLRNHLDGRATLAVHPDAGIVPYRTGLRTIDFGRLNDAYLAREARAPADVAAYFFANAPDAWMVSQRGPDRLWDDGAEAIAHDVRFERLYQSVSESLSADGRGVRLYARRR
jgi:hypothetical protein